MGIDAGVSPGGLAFFFDRSVGQAVPKALRLVHVDVEIHDEVYGLRLVPDEEWIRDGTLRGRVLISRDRKIRRRPDARRLVRSERARMFVLQGNASRLEMLRSMMVAWERVGLVCRAEEAPFIYSIDRSGTLRQLSIS